jgi:hypothetical protein
MIKLMLGTINRVVNFLESDKSAIPMDVQIKKLKGFVAEGDYIFNWLIKNYPVMDELEFEINADIMKDMMRDACVLCKANILDRLLSLPVETKKRVFSAFLVWVWIESKNSLYGEQMNPYVPESYRKYLIEFPPIYSIHSFNDIISFIQKGD